MSSQQPDLPQLQISVLAQSPNHNYFNKIPLVEPQLSERRTRPFGVDEHQSEEKKVPSKEDLLSMRLARLEEEQQILKAQLMLVQAGSKQSSDEKRSPEIDYEFDNKHNMFQPNQSMNQKPSEGLPTEQDEAAKSRHPLPDSNSTMQKKDPLSEQTIHISGPVEGQGPTEEDTSQRETNLESQAKNLNPSSSFRLTSDPSTFQHKTHAQTFFKPLEDGHYGDQPLLNSKVPVLGNAASVGLGQQSKSTYFSPRWIKKKDLDLITSPGSGGRNQLIKKSQSNQILSGGTTSHLFHQMNGLAYGHHKALFTLCFLVSLQLRKFMDLMKSFIKMKPEDLSDPEILIQKQEQISNSLKKFKKYFKNNLAKLYKSEEGDRISSLNPKQRKQSPGMTQDKFREARSEVPSHPEHRRELKSSTSFASSASPVTRMKIHHSRSGSSFYPKYSVCFSELASYLNIPMRPESSQIEEREEEYQDTKQSTEMRRGQLHTSSRNEHAMLASHVKTHSMDHIQEQMFLAMGEQAPLYPGQPDEEHGEQQQDMNYSFQDSHPYQQSFENYQYKGELQGAKRVAGPHPFDHFESLSNEKVDPQVTNLHLQTSPTEDLKMANRPQSSAQMYSRSRAGLIPNTSSHRAQAMQTLQNSKKVYRVPGYLVGTLSSQIKKQIKPKKSGSQEKQGSQEKASKSQAQLPRNILSRNNGQRGTDTLTFESEQQQTPFEMIQFKLSAKKKDDQPKVEEMKLKRDMQTLSMKQEILASKLEKAKSAYDFRQLERGQANSSTITFQNMDGGAQSTSKQGLRKFNDLRLMTTRAGPFPREQRTNTNNSPVVPFLQESLSHYDKMCEKMEIRKKMLLNKERYIELQQVRKGLTPVHAVSNQDIDSHLNTMRTYLACRQRENISITNEETADKQAVSSANPLNTHTERSLQDVKNTNWTRDAVTLTNKFIIATKSQIPPRANSKRHHKRQTSTQHASNLQGAASTLPESQSIIRGSETFRQPGSTSQRLANIRISQKPSNPLASLSSQNSDLISSGAGLSQKQIPSQHTKLTKFLKHKFKVDPNHRVSSLVQTDRAKHAESSRQDDCIKIYDNSIENGGDRSAACETQRAPI